MKLQDKLKQTAKSVVGMIKGKRERTYNAPLGFAAVGGVSDFSEIASGSIIKEEQEQGRDDLMNESVTESVPQIAPQELYDKLEAGETLTFLDIRMPWDHDAMHPKFSVSFPINEIQVRLEELDPEKSYVLSCYHGFTSQDATAFLMTQGFKDVKSMAGGFSGWADAGLPIEGKYAD
jgi:thiosulfate sulfurtransferase